MPEGKTWVGEILHMTEQIEALGVPMNPVPVLPPRPVPPRPTDLLPPRNAAQPSSDAEEPGVAPRTEPRHLMVGRGVSLAGEITACAMLVIEGNVEANLHDCHDVDIAETGLFKGIATIDNAEVRGRFEGELTVRKRLLIRASGHVAGKITYAEIEIEHGGKISGEIALHTGDEAIAEQRRARRAASGD
jgi:cytoskeletal protein CcmA (bactofilin family)